MADLSASAGTAEHRCKQKNLPLEPGKCLGTELGVALEALRRRGGVCQLGPFGGRECSLVPDENRWALKFLRHPDSGHPRKVRNHSPLCSRYLAGPVPIGQTTMPQTREWDLLWP